MEWRNLTKGYEIAVATDDGVAQMRLMTEWPGWMTSWGKLLTTSLLELPKALVCRSIYMKPSPGLPWGLGLPNVFTVKLSPGRAGEDEACSSPRPVRT